MEIGWEDTQCTALTIGSLSMTIFNYIVSKRNCGVMTRPEDNLETAEKYP